MLPESLSEEYTVTVLDALGGVIERISGLATWEDVRTCFSRAQTDGHNVEVEVEEARWKMPVSHALH